MTDDRDSDDRAAYVRALIPHRCPEVTDDDLAAAFGSTQPAELLPIEIGKDIMAVLAAMEAKLDRLAETVGAR